MSSNDNPNRKGGEKKSSEEKDASNSSTLSNSDSKSDVPSKPKFPKIIMVKPVEQTKDFVYSKDSPQMPTTTGRDPCKVKTVCDLTETLSFAEDSKTTPNTTTRRPLSGTESSSDNEDIDSSVCVGAEASTDETDITKSRSETNTLDSSQMPTTTGRDPCKVKTFCVLTETPSLDEDSITTQNVTTKRPLSGTDSSMCVGAEASTPSEVPDEADITKSRSETNTLENEIVNIEEGVNETAGHQGTTEENDYNVKVSQSTELAYSETQRPRNKRLRRRSSVDVVKAQRNISFEVLTTQNPQERSRTRRQPLPAVVEGDHPRNGSGHRLRKAARRAAHFLRKKVFCCCSQSEAA